MTQHNDYNADKKLLSLWWWYVDESYPIDNIFTGSLKMSLDKYGYGILQYENCLWLVGLREKITKWAPDFFWIPEFWIDSIMITSWITAWLDLVGRYLLWWKYDAITIEPCYDTAIMSLKRNAKTLHGIECENDWSGFLLLTEDNWRKIENIFKDWKTKLFYIVPNYSNPSSLSINEADKNRLLWLCQKYWVIIFEDDPYALYSYQDDNIPIPSFYELDKSNGNVIYANSFSKIGFPWLRIWFLIGSPEQVNDISEIQKYSISSPNLITQWVVEEMIKQDIFTQVFKHRKNEMKSKYLNFCKFVESKSDLCSNALKSVNWGFYIWLDVGNGTIFTEEGRKQWLVIIPWKIYGNEFDYSKYIRVTFSQIHESNLAEAVDRLTKLLWK